VQEHRAEHGTLGLEVVRKGPLGDSSFGHFGNVET
jgi:hypothetical protein